MTFSSRTKILEITFNCTQQQTLLPEILVKGNHLINLNLNPINPVWKCKSLQTTTYFNQFGCFFILDHSWHFIAVRLHLEKIVQCQCKVKCALYVAMWRLSPATVQVKEVEEHVAWTSFTKESQVYISQHTVCVFICMLTTISCQL